ncbi:hypothetical protein CBM2605_B90093 [Cupriavidus neocaledonicus]|uniref:Transposase n=1 Tax=Cupriavidus neocaledonicus TaxID=1040979 RepID=A0ABY1VDV3_9BURK|nr:hypothetical protein CBM2605_B90093 [Cupriavidus neocaledonicus]
MDDKRVCVETGGVEDADLWCLQFGLTRPATVVCDDRVSLPH